MKITRLYLAGPMTGLPDLNYPAFRRAALVLRRQGFTVVSPAEHEDAQDSRSYEGWLRWALGLLLTCEAIALLPGWEASKGARIEKAVADALGMRVVYLQACTIEGVRVITRSFQSVAA